MRTRRLIAALAVPFALAACSASGGAPTLGPTGAAVDDRPVKAGGTLVVALSQDPDALDPTTATTFVGREIFASICEKLYDIDADLRLVPQLAATLPETSADGKAVTIKLRPGVVFNDGTPFDAAAVKKSLDRHRTKAGSSRKSELGAVSAVEVVDPATVRLTLSRPFAPLGAQLADRAGMIMSSAALDARGDDFGAKPVCVGPFSFVSRTSGSEIVVQKPDKYYDRDKVKLEKITYKIIADPNVRSANLRSGDVQVAERVATSDVPRAAERPEAPDARRWRAGLPGHHAQHLQRRRHQRTRPARSPRRWPRVPSCGRRSSWRWTATPSTRSSSTDCTSPTAAAPAEERLPGAEPRLPAARPGEGQAVGRQRPASRRRSR